MRPPPTAVPGEASGAPAAPYCPGEYADDLAALSRSARDHEARQQQYTYCIRSAAVYECPFYATDGSLRRTQRRVVAHGTGFGLRQEGGETLVVTNEHVAEWPPVTDADHPVEDVPPGCRRISDSIRIVENEGDDYERDDIPLSRAVVDPQLDVAVLRAKVALPVVPWRMGRSSFLRERNVVDVRGFPLGVLRANNVGKVISAYDHDEQRDWDHDDFVVDALLSPGNSGSPVFAISCRTGELELVGVYHAGYAQGSALNVVVGIDQLRDLLTTLKRSPRPKRDAALALDAGARQRVFEQAQAAGRASFPFGPIVGWVRARIDGALVFELMGRDFPLQSVPALVIEDLPSKPGGGFGAAGRIWAGNRQGLREIDRGALDADTQGQLARLHEALRRDALLAVSYRAAVRAGMSSRERYKDVARLERAARRSAASRQDAAQSALDLAERLCPNTADATGTIADALLPPPGSGPLAAGTETPVLLLSPPVPPAPPTAPSPVLTGSGGR